VTAVAHIAPVPEPQDHKPKKKRSIAAEAREAEAGDGFVVVEQCGVTLRIPVSGKVPLAAIDAFRDGDNYAGTKIMLGDEQWKALTAAGATMDDLDALGAKLMEAAGN
jgi:hypothetical protein